MAPIDLNVMRKQARRAYELSRLARSARVALVIVPMLAFSLTVNPSPLLSIVAGAALLVLAIAMLWRGRTWARAAKVGLLAGSVPFVVPIVLRGTGHCCIGGVCWSACMLGCVAGGLFAGAAIGLMSALEPEDRGLFLVAATAIAGISGSLGCAMAGALGIAGMLVAVIASTLPIAVIARPRAVA